MFLINETTANQNLEVDKVARGNQPTNPAAQLDGKDKQNRELLKAIRKDAEQFYDTSNLWGFQEIFKDYALIGACSTLVWGVWESNLPYYVAIPTTIIGTLYSGGALRGMVNLVHEGSHHTLFKSKWLNKTFQFLYAFPVFRDVENYWKWHKLHHAHVNTADDPENEYRSRWLLDELANKKQKIMLIRPLTLYYTVDFLKHTVLPFWKTKEARWQKLLFWAVIIMGVSLLKVWSWFLLLYALPMFIWFPLITAFVEASEHLGLNEDGKSHRAGRNRFFHPILDFLLLRHNDGPHGLHHWIPKISGKNLKKAYFYLKNKYGIDFIEAISIEQTLEQMLEKE